MIQCNECGKWFHPLGFARHRAMHRDNRDKASELSQLVSISVVECPECLQPKTQEELDTFGGLCEDCSTEC